VHGDYRLDNMIFDPTAARVLAVLDWELSTLGDPVADFAYHLIKYRMASGGVRGLQGADLAALGLPTEREYVAAYCSRRGIVEIGDLEYYLAFCAFRLAGICHGIAGRAARGTAVSPQAKKYAAQVEPLAELAWQTAQRV
jgi:aminoglycoside phosphotransferase (APT) family kinase protein